MIPVLCILSSFGRFFCLPFVSSLQTYALLREHEGTAHSLRNTVVQLVSLRGDIFESSEQEAQFMSAVVSSVLEWLHKFRLCLLPLSLLALPGSQ